MIPGKDAIGICVIFCCTDGKGKFLMAKRGQNARDEQGSWEFGAGQIEFGETVAQAIAREMQEEYGCGGEVLESMPPRTLLREKDGMPTHWIALPHIVRIDPSQVSPNLQENVEMVDWFDLRHPPFPLHSGTLIHEKIYWPYFEKYLA